MDDFQTKVEHFKQTIQESGFETEDSAPITDAPNINVEVEDETPEPQKNHSQEREKRSSKRRSESFRNKIDQLTLEKNVREAQNQELLARVQEQERLLAEKQYQLEQNEQHKNAYYENSLQTRETSILNELKVAKEEGDVDKEIALSKALAQVAAEQSTYGFYKSQLKAQPTPSDYNYDDSSESTFYPVPTVNTNYEEPENDVLDSWLEKNQWADPNSSHFSPRLRQEANALSTELDEMLRYNGSSHMIGTPEYFDSLDNLMAEKYAIQDPPAKQTSNSQYAVAPVSRNGSSMADQYISKNPNNTRQSMSLTEDEYKIARNLQIKLPNGRYATGDEAVRRYAEAKRLSNSSGSNKLIIE